VRICESSIRRFSRIAASSALTVTLSKKASTGAQLRHRRHRAFEVFLVEPLARFLGHIADGFRQRLFLRLGQQLRIRLTVMAARVLLLLGA
jgi:hypothetical protein